MIIHGDNLVALKALLPEYEGRVNCIYIDPPYNTGSDLIYEDDFSQNSEGYKKEGSGQYNILNIYVPEVFGNDKGTGFCYGA